MNDNTKSFLGTEEPTLYTPTSDEKTMAILAHILTLVCGFIAPLIIYLVKKDESKYVAEHAKESLNFQITLFIGFMICFVLFFVIIGIFLMWILALAALILVIVATMKASESKMYRYPFNIRFIK